MSSENLVGSGELTGRLMLKFPNDAILITLLLWSMSSILQCDLYVFKFIVFILGPQMLTHGPGGAWCVSSSDKMVVAKCDYTFGSLSLPDWSVTYRSKYLQEITAQLMIQQAFGLKHIHSSVMPWNEDMFWEMCYSEIMSLYKFYRAFWYETWEAVQSLNTTCWFNQEMR